MNHQKPSLVNELQKIAQRFSSLDKQCCSVVGLELSLPQSNILFEVQRLNKPTVVQLSQALHLDVTTLSRQVQSLVTEGLLIKENNSTDRRSYSLALTTKGDDVLIEIDKLLTKYIEEVFSATTDLEREVITASLYKLSTVIDQSVFCRENGS